MILFLKSIKTSESVSCILVRVLLCISKYFDFIVSPFLCMFKKTSYFLLEKDDDSVTHTCLQHCTRCFLISPIMSIRHNHSYVHGLILTIS